MSWVPARVLAFSFRGEPEAEKSIKLSHTISSAACNYILAVIRLYMDTLSYNCTTHVSNKMQTKMLVGYTTIITPKIMNGPNIAKGGNSVSSMQRGTTVLTWSVWFVIPAWFDKGL